MAIKEVEQDSETTSLNCDDAETKSDDETGTRTYESVIDELGGFGYWQICIFLLLSLPDIFTGFAQMVPVYTGAVPEFGCANDTRKYSNYTSDYQNTSWISDFSNITYKTAPVDVCRDCENFEYDKKFTSIVTEWNLVCDLDYVSDLLHSIQFVGVLFGAILAGQLSDSYGRKKVQFASVGMVGLSGVLSGLAPNWQTYAWVRLIVGVAGGSYATISCVYPLEFVGRQWRTFCGTIGFWAIAQMLLAFLGYYVTEWRYLTLITSGPAILYLLLWRLIPESPRWLAQRGRTEEAEKIICHMAKMNKVPPPDLSVLRDRSTLISKEDKDSKYTDASTSKVKKYTYLDLFRTRKMATITIATTFLWFITYCTYYFLAFNIKNLSGSRYINLFVGAVADQIFIILVIFSNNIFGRRVAYIVYTVVATALTSALLVFWLFDISHDSLLFTGVALTVKAILVGSCYIVQVFTAEVYPTCIRNCGIGAAQVLGRLGAILAPLLVYLGKGIFPFITTAVLLVVSLPVCFLLPETKGQPLQDKMAEHVTKEKHDKAAENTIMI